MALSNLYGVDLTKAGERFGLSAADLEELFSMADTPKADDEADSFAGPQIIQQTEKGRGGVMGFRGPDRPTLTRTYGAEAIGAQALSSRPGGEVSQAPAAPSTPSTPSKPLDYISQYQVPGATLDRFGMVAVGNMRDAGYSDSEILRMVQHTPGASLNIHAREAFGLPALDQPSTSSRSTSQVPITQYQVEGATPDRFGMVAVENMRQAGYSDQDIIQRVQSTPGAAFNIHAQQALGLGSPSTPSPAPSPAPAPQPSITQFQVPGATPDRFGMVAVENMRSQGISDQEIIRRVQSTPGAAFNIHAQQALGLN